MKSFVKFIVAAGGLLLGFAGLVLATCGSMLSAGGSQAGYFVAGVALLGFGGFVFYWAVRRRE